MKGSPKVPTRPGPREGWYRPRRLRGLSWPSETPSPPSLPGLEAGAAAAAAGAGGGGRDPGFVGPGGGGGGLLRGGADGGRGRLGEARRRVVRVHGGV